jgi:ketopantoate reductase
MKKHNILILGASYGSLLGAKLLLAGHTVHLVCLPAEAELINADGIRVRLPVKGREGLVEIDSRQIPGHLSASGAAEVDPSQFDLVALAMQEPQYGAPGVRELMQKIAEQGLPCMSIMNMPPLAFLRRLPGIDASTLRMAFTDPSVWDPFNPSLVTLCSPDPQAFRPPEEKVNVLQVRLPTNFKAARFDDEAHTQILRELEADIEAIRFPLEGDKVELPVKLKTFDSLYVPLAKWSMLLAGNYRCVLEDGVRPIKEAVHGDLAQSEKVYRWVMQVCIAVGAKEADLVPFEKYANAAQGLASPSSAARALAAGARNIERVDRLVQAIARQKGMSLPELDEIVRIVDLRLERNRQAAA